MSDRSVPVLPTVEQARASALEWAKADGALASAIDTGIPLEAAVLRWGADLFRGGRAEDAVTAFSVAVALAPTNADAWTNFGIALDRVGDGGNARACFVRATELDANDADTWLLLGMARERNDDGAEHDFRRALAIAPSATAWKCVGALAARRGDTSGAIDAYRSALASDPSDAVASSALGKALYEEGRFAEARDAYEAAARGEPADAHFVRMHRRASVAADLAEGAAAEGAFARLGTTGAREVENDRSFFESVGAALTRFGHADAALRLARRWCELWPDDPTALYHLASLVGADLDRSPDDYIVATFDAFADGFDEQLVGVLGYDVPEKLCALVKEHVAADRKLDVLDAGCGTGLCGPLLRPLAKSLTGVDLSPKMLERARARGVYDALVEGELGDFLSGQGRAFDLIVAADVLIYFGDLAPTFAAVAGALRDRGRFAFSAEKLAEDGWRLRSSGRFAHARKYVEEMSRSTGLDLVDVRETTLRREGRERVEGVMYLLSLPG